MSNTLCQKSVCIIVCSVIATIGSFAQENNFFKQQMKESFKELFKDLITEPLNPEIMMLDSLIRDIKLGLNKDLLFIDKKQLTISENFFLPYTNDSKVYPRTAAIFNAAMNTMSFDNYPRNVSSSSSNLDFNQILTKLITGKDIYKKFDDKIYTESEKEAIIEITNQLIQENQLEIKSDLTP